MDKEIRLDRKFVKHYKKRIENNNILRKRYKERLELFIEDKSNPVLRDHQLEGKMKKYRSFSIAGDCRVIYFEEEKNIIFVFIDIGTHNQVY
jgi:addiction module RelE/StbE family toxin